MFSYTDDLYSNLGLEASSGKAFTLAFKTWCSLEKKQFLSSSGELQFRTGTKLGTQPRAEKKIHLPQILLTIYGFRLLVSLEILMQYRPYFT